MNINKTLIGLALATMLAYSPIHAAETLFDNGVAVDDVGSIGGWGYSNNENASWQVFDNFSFTQDNSIESVWFQMAGDAGPFVFAVHADDAGKPGAEIFSVPLMTAGVDYDISNEKIYWNGFDSKIGYDYTFDLDDPLTLEPGKYWLSFWGIGPSRFDTLGTGGTDGLYQKNLNDDSLSSPRTGDTPFRLAGEPVDDVLTVSLDIKPDSDDNSINPRSNGVIPVAVLGSMDFDATQIQAATVAFGPGSASPAHKGHVEDVNGDGFMDMVFHFKTQQTGIECGDTEAWLSGVYFGTSGDEPFGSLDSITTVGCGNSEADDDETNDGDGDDAAGGSDAAAADWTMLLALGIVGLLARQRRRISNR